MCKYKWTMGGLGHLGRNSESDPKKACCIKRQFVSFPFRNSIILFLRDFPAKQNLSNKTMALKTLSTFFSPLSLPNTKFLTSKPCLILFEFPRSQKSRLPVADAEGTGAAAPSPGEKFLERQQSFEDAKLILKENNKNKKKKKKDNAIKASRAVASCYGCGAPLHTSDADAPGYVDPETYELVLLRISEISFYALALDVADCVRACVAEEETPPASNRSV